MTLEYNLPHLNLRYLKEQMILNCIVFSTTQKITAYIYDYFPYQIKYDGFVKAAFIYSKTIINNSKKEHNELCFKVVLNEIKLG